MTVGPVPRPDTGHNVLENVVFRRAPSQISRVFHINFYSYKNASILEIMVWPRRYTDFKTFIHHPCPFLKYSPNWIYYKNEEDMLDMHFPNSFHYMVL